MNTKTITYNPALWQLVPKEPTPVMMTELSIPFMAGRMAWRSALAAAPSAPENPADPMGWEEWRRTLAEKVDNYITVQAENEGDEPINEVYDDLKAHILATPFAAPEQPKQEGLTDENAKFEVWANEHNYELRRTDPAAWKVTYKVISTELMWRAWRERALLASHQTDLGLGLAKLAIEQKVSVLAQADQRITELETESSGLRIELATAMRYLEERDEQINELLASQPARTALEQYDLEQSPDYRKGYEDGRLKGFDVGHRYGMDQASQPAAPMDRTAFINRIVLAVAEIPDRDSPEDQPEMMLVTGDELRGIIASSFEIADEAKPQPAAPVAAVGGTLCKSYGDLGIAMGKLENNTLILEIKEKVRLAFGILWHVNAGKEAPAELQILSVLPEQGAYEARKALRELLTQEEKGIGIKAAADFLRALKSTQPSAAPVEAATPALKAWRVPSRYGSKVHVGDVMPTIPIGWDESECGAWYAEPCAMPLSSHLQPAKTAPAAVVGQDGAVAWQPEYRDTTEESCGCKYANYRLQLTDCGGEYEASPPPLYTRPQPTAQVMTDVQITLIRCSMPFAQSTDNEYVTGTKAQFVDFARRVLAAQREGAK